MSNLATYTLLFVIGLVLALMLSFSSLFRSQSGLETSASKREIPSLRALSEAQKSKSVSSRLYYQGEEKKLHKNRASSEQRLSVLRKSLGDGTLESLQLVRPEFLRVLPGYKEQLLPTLKEIALVNLLKRFTESDWSAWQTSSVSDAGAPSAARIYLNDLLFINPDIGRFLETAAQLFHGLYISIRSGNPYDVEEDLYFLFSTAEEIFSGRQTAALPARLLLDPNILSEPSFVKMFEKKRAELTIESATRDPNDVEKMIFLLAGIKPRFTTLELVQRIQEGIIRVSIEGSKGLRSVVVKRLLERGELDPYIQRYSGVRRALAELYLVSAVDALESNDRELAAALLDRSEALVKGLKAQAVLRKYLTEEPEVSPSTEKQTADNSPELSSASPSRKSSGEEPTFEIFGGKKSTDLLKPSSDSWKGWQDLLMLLIIGVIVVLVGGRLLLVYLAHRRTNVDAAAADRVLRKTEEEDELATRSKKAVATKETPPDEEETFEEFSFEDLDEVLNQDVVNR